LIRRQELVSHQLYHRQLNGDRTGTACSAEARTERLQQEQELAKHIAEEDEDDF
jgi:DNA/RNA-binding domain of Phe-tRNA-synthetase-like protein